MTTHLTREAAMELTVPLKMAIDSSEDKLRMTKALVLEFCGQIAALRAERDALAKRVGELEREVNALDESLDGELRGTEDPPWEPPYPQVQHAHSSGKGA